MKGQLRIETVYAFVALDPADNTEGVIAVTTPGQMMMPLIGADLEMVEKLRPIAKATAQTTGATVTLLHFTTRTEIEVIEP